MDIHLKFSIPLFLLSMCFSYPVNSEYEALDDSGNYYEYEFIIELCFKIPQEIVKVKYANCLEITDPGIKLSPEQVVSPPLVSWDADPTYNYTLALVDVSSSDSQFLHWLVMNICGSDLEHGEVIASYLPPNPLIKSGSRIYTFIIYQQMRENRPMNKTVRSRTGFEIQDFADANRFGNPVAYTYFRL